MQENQSTVSWVVQIPLVGSDSRMQLCRCESAEVLADVVHMLCKKGVNGPEKMEILRIGN